MSLLNKFISKRLAKIMSISILGTSMWVAAPICQPKAEAFFVGQAVEALNAILLRNAYKKELLDSFDDPYMQNDFVKQLTEQHGGENTDRTDCAVVDKVMNQMLRHGNYALRANSLPFRWKAVNSTAWNAGCTGNNVVLVNKGLIDDLKHNEDMIAGVVAHELIHGLHQHMANQLANTMGLEYIQNVLNNSVAMTEDQYELFNKSMNYMKVKAFSVEYEMDSDESGFYLMTSAGYNPGGMPLEMIHMFSISRGQHMNFLQEFFSGRISDHPNVKRRMERSIEWFEDYGLNHVSVKNGKDIYFDNELLLTAKPDGELTDWENAYLIAGGIVKGIHDKRLLSSWNFKNKADGSLTFMYDDRPYLPLIKAINENGLGDKFKAMLEKAYAADIKSGKRDDYLLKQSDRKLKIQEEKDAAKELKNSLIERYRTKAAGYIKLGLTDLAGHEARRSRVCGDDSPFIHYAMGVTLLNEREAEKAIKEFDLAIAGGLVNDYLADCYRAKGLAEQATRNFAAAAASLREAKRINPEFANDDAFLLDEAIILSKLN